MDVLDNCKTFPRLHYDNLVFLPPAKILFTVCEYVAIRIATVWVDTGICVAMHV